MAPRILLVDDHQLVRDSLKVLLEREHLQVIGMASDGRAAIRDVEVLRPDIVVLDLAMPGLNGIDAAHGIGRAARVSKVIALTEHRDDAYVIAALRAGIKGYVLKSQSSTELVRAIREVWAGMVYLSPVISRVLVEAYLSGTELAADAITVREREVLQLVAESRTTKEIAKVLGISVKTAESHRTRIMRKLGVHGVADLVRHAIRLRLVES